jgi:hypothetical protein
VRARFDGPVARLGRRDQGSDQRPGDGRHIHDGAIERVLIHLRHRPARCNGRTSTSSADVTVPEPRGFDGF